MEQESGMLVRTYQRVQVAAVALDTVPAGHIVHSEAPSSAMKPAGQGLHAAAMAYE